MLFFVFLPSLSALNKSSNMKIRLFSICLLWTFLPFVSTAFINPQSNIPMTSPSKILPYPEIVHNMALLEHYKIFKGNDIVKYAFFVSPTEIEIHLNDTLLTESINLSVKCYDYNKTDSENQFLLTDEQTPEYKREGTIIRISGQRYDLSKNYVIEIQGKKANIYLHPALGGILDTYFEATDVNDLGVTYNGGNTAFFKLWSPPAAKIELFLFDKNEQLIASQQPLLLNNEGRGIWSIHLNTTDLKGVNTLDGLFYQYKVYAYGEARMALDPYAKSMAAFDTVSTDKIGKGAIVNMNDVKSKPAAFSKTYNNSKFIANETDMIAYEVHVRDFTIQPDIFEPDVAGTYKGFLQKTDYLKTLGITHVQLMPIQNYYTVNETDRAYRKGTARISNYNWGYDPHNYFTPEGWLCTDAKNPYTRIKELRELVQNLHNKGIGVIIDVVYNHVYIAETFENIAPGCYYRLDEKFNISSKTGAGPSFECRRKMGRKLIIESLNHFVKEYHIDGFRFDLMGFLDHETMRAIRQETGKAYNTANVDELILQGEAWVFSDINTDKDAKGQDAACTKINYPKEKFNVAFFNDSSRDSYTGREHNKGFAQGIYKETDRVATGIIGGLISYDAANKAISSEIFNDPYNKFADKPANCLNYLSIHDGFTLWDKINLSVKDPSKTERARIMRLASAMLFTSQGKIILHGGDEILRTKPLSAIDKERHRAHNTEFTDEEEGVVYFHENTYCSNDYTNMFRWDRLTNEYYEFSTQMLDYYKGLILMRRNIPCLRYNNTESVQKGLVFLGADKIGSDASSFSSFDDEKLENLEINFINGPAYQRYYIAGEVYARNMEANFETPEMYYVDFDGNGKGTIRFTKVQIQNFDLSKWGELHSLNIKLIKTQGKWDVLEHSYSGLGHNSIKTSGLSPSGCVNIDLSKPDYVAASSPRIYDSYIAYWLDNTLEKDLAKGLGTSFLQLVVVHNADDEAISVNIPYLENPSDWAVICDTYNAGIKLLKYVSNPTTKKGETNVIITDKQLIVPRKSTTVIAKVK